MDSSGITQLKNISEEKKQQTDKLNKAHFVDSSTSSNIRDEKIQKLKNALGISVDESSSIDEEENERRIPERIPKPNNLKNHYSIFSKVQLSFPT
ncbi:MAG: hypothetical protein U5K00_22240 [Melioribacteraceae bacterium]|nr:hypothetical protein [Melioribacteraceae bacterium]